MKNIDDLLQQKAPTPNRSLSASFTSRVILKIKDQPKRSRFQRVAGIFNHTLTLRTTLTACAGIVVLGGTAAAVTLWSSPTVTPTGTQHLASGNHIVGYDTHDCNYFSELDHGAYRPTHDVMYYEVRKSSSLTDQQLQDSLKAVCETNLANTFAGYATKQLPTNILKDIQSTEIYQIKSISDSSISLVADPHYERAIRVTNQTETYTHFSDNLLVYNEDNKIPFADLKTGDSVVLVVQDTSGKSSETTKDYNTLDHPENVNILAIIKVLPLTGDPDIFFKSIGSDIVRVETCSSSPSGYCRAYPFLNN